MTNVEALKEMLAAFNDKTSKGVEGWSIPISPTPFAGTDLARAPSAVSNK